jgi:hypothetical protein
MKKSKSTGFFGSFFVKDEKPKRDSSQNKKVQRRSCNWIFGMTLMTRSRSYTLFVPTKADLE